MKIKCKICGCEFNPIIEKHYISRDGGKIGIVAAFQSNPEEKLFDTFDCPECGCQVVAQERKRAYVGISRNEDEDEDEDEECDYETCSNEANKLKSCDTCGKRETCMFSPMYGRSSRTNCGYWSEVSE